MQRFREGPNLRGASRQYTLTEHATREKELYKAMLGIDDLTAETLVKGNVTGEVMDPMSLLAGEAMVYARAKARAGFVEQVKELGINLNDVQDDVAQALMTGGRDFTQLGLKSIDERIAPALAGYVFDYDVSNIIHRVLTTTAQDIDPFRKLMKKYVNYWKGIVTATPGFHARNFISDTFNLFTVRGPRAFNMKEKLDSFAAVASTLDESSRKTFLGTINANDRWYTGRLSARYGNLSLDELTDEAVRRGAISEATMGFDPQEIGQKVLQGGGKTPLRSGSRWVAERIENLNRFHTFLIDYSDIATDPALFPNLQGDELMAALRKADDAKLDWAARESKIVNMDYLDLSDFEQKTLKSFIPFYTFLRKNLSRQVMQIYHYPEMYSLIPKIEDFLTTEDPEYDPALVPEWMKELGAFPIAKNEDGMFRYIIPGQQFAYNALNLLPFEWEEGRLLPHWNGENLKDEIINSTAPWVRRFASTLMDTENPYNFFYKEEMEPTADAPYLMRLFASRPGVVPLVDGFLRTIGFQNGAHIDERDGKLQIDSRMAITLEEFIPVLRQFEFAFYLPQTFGRRTGEGRTVLERVIEESWFKGAQDDYDGTRQAFQMLSYYLGIKLDERSQEEERQRLGRDIYYSAQEALDRSRENLPGRQQRRLESSLRREQSIRRLGG